MTAVLRRRSLRLAAAVTYYSSNPSLAAGLVYSQMVRWRFRRCGSGLKLRMSTTILGHGNIAIGNRFVSMGNLYLYALDAGELEIGDDCDVNTNVQFGASSGRLIIGNNVMIGPNVVVRVSNHGMARDKPMIAQLPQRGEVIIEDDVWIGSNAVITPDVRVAKGTIVGAGAVVTRSTEPYSIVAGVPAKKIGERT
jgi:galactoside O-acetyltransferase